MSAFQRSRIEEGTAIVAVLLVLFSTLVDPRLSLLAVFFILVVAFVYMARQFRSASGKRG